MDFPANKKVFAYGRVSSLEQAENHYAAEQQIDRLKRENPDVILFDIESGDSKDRANFNQLEDEIRQENVLEVQAISWDRITRNEETYLDFKTLLKKFGVKLRLLNQGPVDLSTSAGELSADMQALFAVHERRVLQERVLRGNAYRRKRKVACARAPWGYSSQDEKYVLDTRPMICVLKDRPSNYLELYEEPDNSPNLMRISRYDIVLKTVRLLFEKRRPRQVLKALYEEYGLERKTYVDVNKEKKNPEENSNGKLKKRLRRSNAVLTEELVLWNSSNSLIEWIKNPVLRGHTAYCKSKNGQELPSHEWEMHHNTHPDQILITEEEFNEIQLILKSNSRKAGAPGSKFYVTGLVYCEQCGHKMVFKSSPKHRYYGCRNSGVGCSNQQCIRLDSLDFAIINQLFERATQIRQDKASSESLPELPELADLRQQLEVIDLALTSSSKTKGSNDVLRRTRHALVQEIDQLSNHINALHFDRATALDIISHPQAGDLAFWHTRTYEEREILYEKLVKRVAVHNGQVVVVDLTV